MKDGQVSLQIKLSKNQKVTIFTGTERQTVGWSILVPPHTLTATCEAIKPSCLIAIDGNVLRHLCDEDHEFGYKIMQALTKNMRDRLRDTRSRLTNLIYLIREDIKQG